MKGTRTYCTVNTTKKKNVNVNLNTYDTKKGKTRSQVEKQWDDAKFSSLGIQKIKHFFPYFYQFYSSLFCHSNVFRSVKNELLYLTLGTPLQACIDIIRHMPFLLVITELNSANLYHLNEVKEKKPR